MVTLLLDQSRLEVVLSATERLLAFHKGNVQVERSAIQKVQLTDDGWTWLRGVPSPGTHVRGRIAMGTWKSAGALDFAVILRRRPGVVIDLEGHDRFERLVVTTRHGLALALALRLDVSEGASDVVDLTAGPGAKRRSRASAKPAT